MRKLIQFVAILAVGLIAVQPALAGLACVPGMHMACAPGCPMAMGGMGANCPMAGQMAAIDCSQDCCAQTHPQAIVLPALVTKLQFALLASPSAASAATFPAGTDFASRSPVTDEASSPPLYLLNQVLRI